MHIRNLKEAQRLMNEAKELVNKKHMIEKFIARENESTVLIKFYECPGGNCFVGDVEITGQQQEMFARMVQAIITNQMEEVENLFKAIGVDTDDKNIEGERA